MLRAASIRSYLAVLFLIPGTFSQNELFYRSKPYCHRFTPPVIASALGLCTYPCLLSSKDQAPKIVVQLEPDGRACRIYNGFLQTTQVGICRGGVCRETQDYGALKRMKRDASASVSSSPQNISSAQKEIGRRHDSEKPKPSKRQRIERRRREMWSRCDCASMRGFLIDMSYAASGLALGRRSRRGRRKVGCRVICFFLINKYKHDPNWASLFKARFNATGSRKFDTAAATLSGGNRSGQNIRTNGTVVTSGSISAAGLHSESGTAEVNGSSTIGSGGIVSTNNQASGSAVAGVPGNVVQGEVSNVAAGGTLRNGVNAGSLGSNGASFGTSMVPKESSLRPSTTGTGVTSGKPAGTVPTEGIRASGTSIGINGQIGGSAYGASAGGTSTTGIGGISTGGTSGTGNTSNESGRGLSSISAGGTSTRLQIGTGSGTEPQNATLSSSGSRREPTEVTSSSTSALSEAVRRNDNLDNGVTNAEDAHGRVVSTTRANGAGTSSGINNENSLPNTGMSGANTTSSTTTTSSAGSSNQGRGNPSIGGVGSALTGGAGTESVGKNGSVINSGSLENRTTVTRVHKVERVTSPTTATTGGTGSVSSNHLGSETVGNRTLTAGASALPQHQGVGSPMNGPENNGGSSTVMPSSGSAAGISSLEGAANGNTARVPAGDGTGRTHVTDTGGSTGSTGRSPNASSISGPSGVTVSVPSGGGSSSGEGAVNGVNSNSGVSVVVPESGTSNRPSLSSGGARSGEPSEVTEIPTTGGGLSGVSTGRAIVNTVVATGGGENSSGTSGTAHTGSERAVGAPGGGTTPTTNAGLLNDSGHSLSRFPGAGSAGSNIGTATNYGTGFESTPRYGVGPISGHGAPVSFGWGYGAGAGDFGSTGRGMTSGSWGPASGMYNGMSAGYGNTGNLGTMPGVQPYGGARGYGNSGRFPGDVGIYEDDIFFQE